MTSEQDKQIAYVSINKLRGQAQYDFLMGYFEEIRRKARADEREKIIKLIDKRFEGHKCMERWEWNEFKHFNFREAKEGKR